ncbi:Protein argonaute [Trichinella spiralis]|uniref:Protein argonaute n=1 Tax=Trichinella spiralis TaxID=6334 RepID=A0ABR3K3H6_TRISP
MLLVAVCCWSAVVWFINCKNVLIAREWPLLCTYVNKGSGIVNDPACTTQPVRQFRFGQQSTVRGSTTSGVFV